MREVRVVAVVLVCLIAAPLLAATDTWTGASSNLWSDPANWSGATVPSAGDDLVFPSTGANQSNTNDLPAGTAFNSISITGGSYSISGNAINLGAGGITFSSTTAFSTLLIPITLTAAQTWALDSGNQGLLIDGAVNLNGNNLTLSYSTINSVFFGGAISGTGTITVAGTGSGGPIFSGTSTTTAPLSTNGSHLVEVKGTYTGPITINGSTSSFFVAAGAVAGNITVNGGFMWPTLSGGTATTGNLTLAPATGSNVIYRQTVNGTTPGTFSQLNVNGTVSLGNAILAITSSSVIPAGSVFTIINNDSTDPVVETFSGLPEGALVTANPAQAFRISYVGGDGNDVVLTSLGAFTTTTTLTSSLNPSPQGVPVTFTATVTSPAGGPLTGTVVFMDGAATIATTTLDATGHATLRTSGLSVGTHSITARYLGMDNTLIGGSTSAPISQVVNVATAVPTLDPRLIALLAAVLAAIGWFSIRASQ